MAELLSFLTPSRSRKSKPTEELRRWGPWVGFGLVLLALCLGWLLLPLRQWMEGLQSWLLGLGAWGVVIFTLILIVATFFADAGLAVADRGWLCLRRMGVSASLRRNRLAQRARVSCRPLFRA
jgi:hypothetical protein